MSPGPPELPPMSHGVGTMSGELIHGLALKHPFSTEALRTAFYTYHCYLVKHMK
ncbi:hypothetical protein HOLleu_40449 [Holothuria leucospilota]|uniref:Uncharacterized protein n=1 Tax=Holothuria leucospilota TaxID=206669 RepID=A0A9Q0YF70_HOLLE|nr:hypothetical protein HOLleu_40449 [Holothuria leucospilota]